MGLANLADIHLRLDTAIEDKGLNIQTVSHPPAFEIVVQIYMPRAIPPSSHHHAEHHYAHET
jgi:hypothetical protein